MPSRAFRASDGCRDDGHSSPRTWLRWKTRITPGAATGAMRWMRRLAAHPLVRGALADARISESWAKQICAWTDKVPAEVRDDADSVLLAAARGGMDLDDIGGLAEEIQRQTARPDTDGPDDGFDDRSVSLQTTFGGAGTLRGNLAPSCAAAVSAVLESLGKRAGPEDLRSRWQRQHDALEEACRLLVASNCLPDRAGQPTQIMLHIDLDRLRGMPGAGDAEATFPGPIAPPGAECDATIVPVVTGHVDPVALDRLVGLVRGTGSRDSDDDAETARRELSAAAARRLVLAAASDVLSGPAGLAACLRTGVLGGAAAAVSLPLDTGKATDSIPRAPAAAGLPAGPALPLARLLPAPRPLPPAPHPAPPQRRQDQPGQPGPIVLVSPFDHGSPRGLADRPQPGRHRDRDQPRRRPGPAQPQPADPGRLTRRRPHQLLPTPRACSIASAAHTTRLERACRLRC